MLTRSRKDCGEQVSARKAHTERCDEREVLKDLCGTGVR